MNSIEGAPAVRGGIASRAAQSELSLFRLYTLRLAYFVMAAGIAVFFWPNVIHHTSEFAALHGIQFALLGGLGLVAALGLRYPAQMLPILLFEFTWKIIYLAAFAVPLWREHQITPAVADDIKSVLFVVIFIPLVPWLFVFRRYALTPGDRWK